MSAEHIFEIRHLENAGDKFSVNLQGQSCTSRKWQLTSLQCVHANSSMKNRNFKVESDIPDMYKKENIRRYTTMSSTLLMAPNSGKGQSIMMYNHQYFKNARKAKKEKEFGAR